jgi:hypothetical protein
VKNWYLPEKFNKASRLSGHTPVTWPIIHHLADEDIAGGRSAQNRGVLAGPVKEEQFMYTLGSHPPLPQPANNGLFGGHLGLFSNGPILILHLKKYGGPG